MLTCVMQTTLQREPMPYDLRNFTGDLAAVIGKPTRLRPFVCEGSPLECDVFIVGYNPATSMEGDWWQYWKEGYGFQKGAWFNDYQSQRGGISKTRGKIEDIVATLPGVRILEANIDARPSAKKSEYPKPVTRPFDFLLDACRPKVVIAHGTDAVGHLQSWKPKGTLIECKHFIYVGRERTAEIVAETRAALQFHAFAGEVARIQQRAADAGFVSGKRTDKADKEFRDDQWGEGWSEDQGFVGPR